MLRHIYYHLIVTLEFLHRDALDHLRSFILELWNAFGLMNLYFVGYFPLYAVQDIS